MARDCSSARPHPHKVFPEHWWGRAVDGGQYASVTPQTTTQPTHDTVMIRYLRRSAIRIRGPRTGRVCTFRPQEPDQLVDRRDAEALLRTGLFRKGGQPVSANGGKSGQSNGSERGG